MVRCVKEWWPVLAVFAIYLSVCVSLCDSFGWRYISKIGKGVIHPKTVTEAALQRAHDFPPATLTGFAELASVFL